MAVRAHQPYSILRTVIEDLATPDRPETMVRKLGVNFEDIGVWRRHPVEDRYFFFNQFLAVDPTRSIRGHISNSSCLTGSSNTPEYRHTLDQRDSGPDGVCI